ncbi:MAG: hypothetical protein NTW96_24750 [Planctomycetia bacterium]|nr:hypothetical protein [Planctomycetia bacterium]
MHAPCDVRLPNSRDWLPATLTDEHSPMSGVPMVIVATDGKAHGPRTVDAVRITAACPVALFDAAVEVGFYVLGAPGRKRRKRK